MTLPESMRRGLYFEEIEPGRHFTSPSRTATYAAQGPFGQRVAHGLLVLSIASGLATRTGFMEGTVLAWRDIQEWKFTKPVFIGDTVRVDIAVLETNAMPRWGGGLVQLDLRVRNQQDEVGQRGRWGILG